MDKQRLAFYFVAIVVVLIFVTFLSCAFLGREITPMFVLIVIVLMCILILLTMKNSRDCDGAMKVSLTFIIFMSILIVIFGYVVGSKMWNKASLYNFERDYNEHKMRRSEAFELMNQYPDEARYRISAVTPFGDTPALI